MEDIKTNQEIPNDHDEHVPEIKETGTQGLDEAANDSWALYEYRESPRGLYSTCYVDGFKAGAEWRDRQLNWARDLVQAGIDKPEEAVNILKRLKELIQLLP